MPMSWLSESALTNGSLMQSENGSKRRLNVKAVPNADGKMIDIVNEDGEVVAQLKAIEDMDTALLKANQFISLVEKDVIARCSKKLAEEMRTIAKAVEIASGGEIVIALTGEEFFDAIERGVKVITNDMILVESVDRDEVKVTEVDGGESQGLN
jgi:hypothetical protein